MNSSQNSWIGIGIAGVLIITLVVVIGVKERSRPTNVTPDDLLEVSDPKQEALGYENPRGHRRLPDAWKDGFNGQKVNGYEVGPLKEGKVGVRVTFENGSTVEFKMDRDFASTLGIMMKEDADNLAR